MKVVFIAGTYGSGTSALAGALDKLGLDSLRPHFKTNDPRTPNSFESLAFRNLVNQFANEPTLSVDESKAEQFIQALRNLLSQADGGPAHAVVLKMPLASICLPQIIEAVNPCIIWVHRPIGEIEASRLRRKWTPNYGAMGARVICSKLMIDLMEQKKSFLAISYRDLLEDSRREILRVVNFCGLQVPDDRILSAVESVRKGTGK